MKLWRTSRASQISLLTASFLYGVAVSRLWPHALTVSMLVIALAGVVVIGWRLCGLVIIFALVGWYRGMSTTLPQTILGSYVGQKVVLQSHISDDPGVSVFHNLTEVAFIAGNVVVNGHHTRQSVRVYTAGYMELKRGYLVTIEGTIKTSKTTGAPQISYAKVTVRSTHQSWLERLRQGFMTDVHEVLPDPMAGFGLGLLIGARALINKDLQDTLNAVGLSHLVAVSGYNLTIIIKATQRLSGRISYYTATAVSCWLIIGFLLVTGFSASIVRAALVSSLGLLIAYYGYSAKPTTLLAVPALLTVAYRPDYLLHDLGWQLSFLAFFGIMVVAPLLEERLVRQPNMIKSLVIESLSAQMTTAPLIVAVFGNLSLVSPVSNLVILPLVPLAMLLSFATGLAGLCSGAIAAWVALPTLGLLGLMIGVIQWFAGWPHANIELHVARIYIIGAYSLLAIIALALWRHARRSPFDRSPRSVL